ncbi:MAG: hypothetical protein N3D16_08420 [Anaerolineales bacterium]|nr:hypothetical protein [Anaerolineales bacterium]
MKIAAIWDKVHWVIAPDGRKTAVLVDIQTWECILSALEDIEDGEEMQQQKSARETTVPWEILKRQLQ